MFDNSISYTVFRKRIFYSIVALALTVCFVCAFLLMINYERSILDKNAKVGDIEIEDVPKEYGFQEMEAEGVAKVKLCILPKIEDKIVYLNLVNLELNEGIYIRAEIYTVDFIYKNGQIVDGVPDKCIGKTDFIKPGEYLETVKLKKKLKGENTPIIIKISTLEEETRKSHGAFDIKTTFNFDQ